MRNPWGSLFLSPRAEAHCHCSRAINPQETLMSVKFQVNGMKTVEIKPGHDAMITVLELLTDLLERLCT